MSKLGSVWWRGRILNEIRRHKLTKVSSGDKARKMDTEPLILRMEPIGHYRTVTPISSNVRDEFELCEEEMLYKRGSMKVMLGYCRSTGEKVVIKTIQKSWGRAGVDEGKEIHQLRRSVWVMNACRECPYTVNTIKYFESPGELALVMDWGGKDLFSFIQRKPLPEHQAKSIILAVTKGLEWMHSHRMIHRDIKPENICVNKQGEAKLVDFGLSGYIKDGKPPEGSSGSYMYIAPELHGGDIWEGGIESDMWSLGVVTAGVLWGLPALEAAMLGGGWSDLPLHAVDLRARAFVSRLLVKDPHSRMTVVQALQHPWLKGSEADIIEPSLLPLRVPSPMLVRFRRIRENDEDKSGKRRAMYLKFHKAI